MDSKEINQNLINSKVIVEVEQKEGADPFKSKNEITRTFYLKNEKSKKSRINLYEDNESFTKIQNGGGILKQSSS